MFTQDDFNNVRGLNNNIYPGFYGVCRQWFIGCLAPTSTTSTQIEFSWTKDVPCTAVLKCASSVLIRPGTASKIRCCINFVVDLKHFLDN